MPSAIWAAEPWYYGVWTVVGSDSPGISAMTTEEAKSWDGSVAHYTADIAEFRKNECSDPVYRSTEQSAAEFYDYYRFDPAKLGIDGKSIETIEVGCPDDWIQPGSKLLKVDSRTAYTSWDGVYFKLNKR
ncbi:hypothetical protein GCM10028792_27140 [Salinisphaera aquimarina]